MTLKTIINGIDVGRQRAAATSVSDPPDVVTSTEWLGGTQTRTVVATAAGDEPEREFAIDADYPDALLGSGKAPSPNELFVASLGSSLVASFVLAAAAAGVRIESMRVHSRLGRRPATDLELHGEVDADVSPADLEQLVAVAIAHSHVAGLCGRNVRLTLDRVDGSTAP